MVMDVKKNFHQTHSKVAVITGANAGIGFTLAERLLKANHKIRLCLACRNYDKGQAAAKALKESSPDVDIWVVLLDTSSVESVYAASKAIKERYDHIDYLYLNAGMMKVTGVDWHYFWKGLFSSRVFFMFTTGEGLLKQEDNVTNDGLQNVFQTNVFGHYVLIKELEDVLGNLSGKPDGTSQLIWTSSSASLEHKFDIEDFQHKKGNDPYSSSKFAMDVISVGLNSRMNKFNIFSHAVCPGLVMTNLTYGILPQWFWTLSLPLLWLLRFFVPSMTSTTDNGSEALLWLSQQNPSALDPQSKFLSEVSVLNKPFVATKQMNIDPDKAERLMQELDRLDLSLRARYKK
ncbi:unnamed protein product [Lymnaea stagnalis]|uniref:3-keto-steroid reductase/17-beta-hydroxysteroid dehydrogenase 7 n=1 Tax=Lymnaea stagnalis TaxID=6523 RepID=A0AAV2IER8_LYMST